MCSGERQFADTHSLVQVSGIKKSPQQAAQPQPSLVDTDKRIVSLKLPGEQQRSLTADLVLWTAGSGPVTKVSERRLSLPFPQNQKGAMRTERTLRVVDHSRVFALGDVAGPDLDLTPEVLPATAQVRLVGA